MAITVAIQSGSAFKIECLKLVQDFNNNKNLTKFHLANEGCSPDPESEFYGSGFHQFAVRILRYTAMDYRYVGDHKAVTKLR